MFKKVIIIFFIVKNLPTGLLVVVRLHLPAAVHHRERRKDVHRQVVATPLLRGRPLLLPAQVSHDRGSNPGPLFFQNYLNQTN